MATNWHECVLDSDYEISDEYPYPIKRKGSDKIISEHIMNDGYVRCYMNGKKYLMHRVVASQFIPNDDPVNKTEVDHINHNRTDNRIENLRWTTKSENSSNRTRSSRGNVEYEYFDAIPLEEDDSIDDIIEVTEYNNHEFDNLFFYNDEFWVYNGIKFRRVTIQFNSAGNAFIQTYDTNHKMTTINYIKFKKSYDIKF